MLSEGLGDAVTVIVDSDLWVFFLLLRGWLRRRWDSVGDDRGVAGLLHLTAPRVGEKPLAGYIAASWSPMVVVTVLVDLIKDLDETLLGLLPCFHDSTNPILCCCELGSSLLQLRPQCSLSVLGTYGSLYSLGQQRREGF